jgi:hypothetical protein
MKSTFTAIFLVTLLALLVRCFTATWTGLTTDEANGVFIATTGSLPELVKLLQADGNPPLLHVMLRLYSMIFGHSDLAVKLFAIALGTLQIPLSFLICKQFLSRRLALQVAVLLAICPPLVRYSTLLRAYSLISLLGLLSTWACLKSLSARKVFPWPVLYGVSTAALVYGHYWGGFVAIGQACLAVIGFVRGWFDRTAIKHWFFGAAISVALFLPWTPILYYQLQHDMSPWDVAQNPSVLVSEMASYVFAGTYYTLQPADQLGVLFSTVIFLFATFTPRVMLTDKFDGRFWRLITLCGYGAGLLVSLQIPALRERYLTPFMALFAIVYVTAFASNFTRLPKLAGAILPIVIWLPIWTRQLAALAEVPETGTPAVVAKIEREADRKKDLVVISWPVVAPAVMFYLSKDLDAITFPDLVRTSTNRWDGMIDRLRQQSNLDRLLSRMQKTLTAGGKIWLVDRSHAIESSDYEDNAQLDGLSYSDTELVRMNQIRTWLTENSQQIGTNSLAPGRDTPVFLSVYRQKIGTEKDHRCKD